MIFRMVLFLEWLRCSFLPNESFTYFEWSVNSNLVSRVSFRTYPTLILSMRNLKNMVTKSKIMETKIEKWEKKHVYVFFVCFQSIDSNRSRELKFTLNFRDSGATFSSTQESLLQVVQPVGRPVFRKISARRPDSRAPDNKCGQFLIISAGSSRILIMWSVRRC